MDVNVYAILIVIPLLLALLGFLGKKSAWAIFPLFGGFTGTGATIAIFFDGSLTQWQGSTNQVLAAANGNIYSDFGIISLIPLFVAMICYLISMFRAMRIL